MTQHHVAVARGCRRGLPTLSQAGLEQLIGCGRVIPHGDRRDRAESRGVEYQPAIAQR